MKASSLQRLLFIFYLLLWPPFLILALRTSDEPQVAGRWSHRMLLLLVIYLAMLLFCGFVVGMAGRRGSLVQRALSHLIARCRSHSIVMLAAASGPPIAMLLAVIYAGRIGVVLTPALVVCLLNLALLVITWEAILLFAERSAKSRRVLLKKCGLAAASTLLTVGVFELVAALTGLGDFIGWDINPRNLDGRMTCDEFDVRIITNSQGLRESTFIDPHHPGTFRVVVVGDSMTFGWGVEGDEVYPKVAETRLRALSNRPTVEVINMGRPGATVIDYLRFVQQYAARLKPDVIVVGFGIGNDCPVSSPLSLRNRDDVDAAFSRHLAAVRQGNSGPLKYSRLLRLMHAKLYRPLSTTSVGSSTGERGPIFGEPNPLDPDLLTHDIERDGRQAFLNERYKFLQQNGWIEKGLRWELNPWLVHTVLFHHDGAAKALGVRLDTLPAMKNEWLLCEKLLKKIKATSEELGARLLIVAIPQAYQVSEESVEFLRKTRCDAPQAMLDTRRVNDWLSEFCVEKGIVCVDPLSTFRERKIRSKVYFPRDGHLTPTGQKILGEMLARALVPLMK